MSAPSGLEPLDGLTVREVALKTFRTTHRIRALIHKHNLAVIRIWVPIPRAFPLERQIWLLPPATVRRLLELTVFRPRKVISDGLPL